MSYSYSKTVGEVGAVGCGPMQRDFAGNPYPYLGHQEQTQNNTYLCVSDIERLAKAGVKIELGKVVAQADLPGFVIPPTTDGDIREMDRLSDIGNSLSKAIWSRWLRARRAIHDPDFGDPLDGRQRPFSLMAHQYGDTVHVSVHPTDQTRLPFELTDSAIIFPSDALMAKIALWEKDNP